MSSNESNGGICTEELGSSGVYCLSGAQNVGLVVVALSGSISLLAVLFIFALIARNVIYLRRRLAAARADAGTPSTEIESTATEDEAPVALIDKPMDLFLLSLFFGSFFQALGVVLEIKWIKEGRVSAGSFCSAQGVLQNLGQSAVAIQTTIITIHTFATIWYQRGVVRLRTATWLVGSMWLFLTLFIAISASVHHTPPFYYPTPYWCWIHSHYSKYRIAGESFWLWLAFAVAVLYTPLCFFGLGKISPDGWTYKINSREEAEAQAVRTNNLQTFKLIISAIAYCVPVLPTALARWFLVVHGDTKPFGSAEAQFSVKAIFSLSGVMLSSSSLHAKTTSFLGNPSVLLENLSIYLLPFALVVTCLAACIALNIFDIVWIYYYILSATDPVPRRKPNESRQGWKAYYVMMYFCGFLIGLVNIGVWLRYIRPVCRRFTFTSPKLLVMLGYFLRFLIVVLAVFMCLGPFFAPLIGLKISQVIAWDRRCDSRFSVEVILDGRSYYESNVENPSFATFYFGQPGRRTEYYKYGLTQDDNDTTTWHLHLSHVSIPPDLDAVYHPLAQNLSYRFANHSFAATCNTNATSNAVFPCMEGSFDDGNALSLTINDMRTGIVTKLRAFDKGVWAPADDAPSVLLREVQPDDSLGSIDVLRTAVTMKGDCTRLKLCVTKEKDIDTLLAAVGLILKAQGNFAHMCTTPNSY